jgi:hypothetical protein
MKSSPKLSLSERIERYIISKNDADCWLTNLKSFNNGYIQIKVKGKKQLIHRLVYELNYGDIPPDKLVSHSCKNKGCINPSHLVLVTFQEMKKLRKYTKSSRNQGENHGKSKLDNQKVSEIKLLISENHLTLGQIAYKYRVSYSTVYQIKIGRRWKHL